MTLVGTLRKNKKELPVLFTSLNKERDCPSSIFGFTSKATLVSYKPKKNKVINLLSTMHTDGQIDVRSGDAIKPEIVTFYNKTKFGVDMSDALQKAYSVSRIANRWPLAIFFFILNIAGVNSCIVERENKGTHVIRKDFLFNLGKSFVSPHCKRRLYDSNKNPDLGDI